MPTSVTSACPVLVRSLDDGRGAVRGLLLRAVQSVVVAGVLVVLEVDGHRLGMDEVGSRGR